MKVNTWHITLTITDHNVDKPHTAASLAKDIRELWLPPSFHLEIRELKVGLVDSEDRG